MAVWVWQKLFSRPTSVKLVRMSTDNHLKFLDTEQRTENRGAFIQKNLWNLARTARGCGIYGVGGASPGGCAEDSPSRGLGSQQKLPDPVGRSCSARLCAVGSVHWVIEAAVAAPAFPSPLSTVRLQEGWLVKKGFLRPLAPAPALGRVFQRRSLPPL